MSDQRIVLKVGGSLLFDKNLQIQQEKVQNFAKLLQGSQKIIAVIVGGGKLARTYINAARSLDGGESLCDTFGIGVSRLNALLLITALGDRGYPEAITDLSEARTAALWKKIVVAGGFVPGQSTTSVTFEIAEALRATNVIILTNVDGIYDKDPNAHTDAKKFDEITIPELEKVIYGEGGNSQSAAGEYRILDAVSLQILKRSQFAVRLTNGDDLDGLQELFTDPATTKAIGTRVVH